MQTLDDERLHFLTLLGDACAGAKLAGLSLRVDLADGGTVSGICEHEDVPVGVTGHPPVILIDGEPIDVRQVTSFTVLGPG